MTVLYMILSGPALAVVALAITAIVPNPAWRNENCFAFLILGWLSGLLQALISLLVKGLL